MMPTDGLIGIWLYVNRRGQIYEVPACISKKKPDNWTYAIPACDRDNYTYIQEISREQGMLFNNTVWFKKKNFEKAKTIFVNDYAERTSYFWDEYQKAETEMNNIYMQQEAR